MHRTSSLAFIAASAFVLVPNALAVKPATWVHEQPKDFTSGDLDNIVVTSRGEVALGRKADTLHVPGEEVEAVNALARAGDGRIYAATGPQGIIYRIDGDKVAQFAKLPDNASVFSLLFTQEGMLLAGTGGAKQARIYKIDGNGKAEVFHEPAGARYVWAMARGPQGEIYAATGIEGKLFVIQSNGGSGKVLTKIKSNNILCLACGPDGMLYGGTDEDGLIYRFNPATGQPFVMYDAQEAEISSIAVDAEGNIYAATASAESARPGRPVADAPAGRPDRPESKPTTTPSGPARPGDAAAATSPAATRASESEKRPGKQDGGDEEAKTVRVMMVAKPMGKPVQADKPLPVGNAIYRIDLDGFVTEVFRESVMILALAEEDGTLYAATGNEGRIYAITPKTEKTVVLAKLQSQQITSLLRLPRGELVLGTANQALLVKLSDAFAPKGTLVGEPLDAEQIVKWGRIHWDVTVPEGTKLTVATRSGNVEDTESEAWDAWSSELDATMPQQIASPGARFLQYRLTLQTTVPNTTPVLRKVTIPRVEENRPPRIGELRVQAASEAAKDPSSPPRVKAIAGGMGGMGSMGGMGAMGGEKTNPQPDYYWVAMWKAEDPNQDQLEFQVFAREAGKERWIRIAKELEEPYHLWDTRTMPDGKYEIRVMADDTPGNPPGSNLTDARLSDPFIVDNSPPDVTVGAVATEGKGRVTVNATMTDALGFISGAEYSVNSDEKWIPLNALDDMFDSYSEAVSFTVDGLEPGDHRIALRVRDRGGNTRYVTQYVNIMP
ncbi:MAG TPA: hypothetical protein VLM89_04150 [Phycisphaerae bacterium]|nr:hypothetical protein [Phycisphaerae bacterium]